MDPVRVEDQVEAHGVHEGHGRALGEAGRAVPAEVRVELGRVAQSGENDHGHRDDVGTRDGDRGLVVAVAVAVVMVMMCASQPVSQAVICIPRDAVGGQARTCASWPQQAYTRLRW